MESSGQNIVVPEEEDRRGEVLVPQGHSTIAQRLGVGFDMTKKPSPGGTVENAWLSTVLSGQWVEI